VAELNDTPSTYSSNRSEEALRQRRQADVHHSRQLGAISCVLRLLAAATDDGLPCWSQDPELFFADSPADIEQAKEICLTCPVRLQCLAGAVQRREPWGVWGGEYFVGGVVARKRPRGRPRKRVIAA